MTRERLEKLLRELQAGRLSRSTALDRLRTLPY
jgi:hypothetical protein